MESVTAEAFVHHAMDRKAHQVAFELRSGLVDLAIISRVAPMLGFLGTALSVLVIVSRAVDPSENWTVLLGASRGIYFGLVPMLFGLGTGLLAKLTYSYLRGQADTLSAQIVEPEPSATLTPGVLGFVE